jgi:hypothetical protein
MNHNLQCCTSKLISSSMRSNHRELSRLYASRSPRAERQPTRHTGQPPHANPIALASRHTLAQQFTVDHTSNHPLRRRSTRPFPRWTSPKPPARYSHFTPHRPASRYSPCSLTSNSTTGPTSLASKEHRQRTRQGLHPKSLYGGTACLVCDHSVSPTITTPPTQNTSDILPAATMAAMTL